MDSSGWNYSPVLTNISSSWSNDQLHHGIQQNFTLDIFNNNPIQFNPSCNNNNQNMPAQLAPVLDPVLAKSVADPGTSWSQAINAEMYSRNSLVADFSMPSNGTTSLESLDCLLSGTNSYTDTSLEEDDISMNILSDCNNLWNFGSNISSGDSASNSSKKNEIASKPMNATTSKRSHEQINNNTNHNYLVIPEDSTQPKLKKAKAEKRPASSNINFRQPSSSEEPDSEAIAQMKEMIYRAAAFRPVNLGEELVEKPKRKNVKISSDPQTVAARQRREKISEKIRVLQRLVPGGSKMDTASMLDEAANYLKFLRSQVKALETLGHKNLDFVNSSSSSSCPTATTTPQYHSFSSIPFNHSFLHRMQINPFSPHKP